jgi:MerR family transcriptional regulator, aldehyde-responsive regulator
MTPARNRHATADAPAGPLSIQQVSRLTGLSVPTLRYYEDVGLITDVDRDMSSGHRRYARHVVERIESLAHLRAAGLSIDAMRALMSSGGHSTDSIATKIELLAAHRERVDTEITALTARRDFLDNRIAYWQARSSGDHETADRLETQSRSLYQLLH